MKSLSILSLILALNIAQAVASSYINQPQQQPSSLTFTITEVGCLVWTVTTVV
jgi:hypothetical protein